jgi:hypothetical protein
MTQDGLQDKDGAAIEPLARFGSLHNVPTFKPFLQALSRWE